MSGAWVKKCGGEDDDKFKISHILPIRVMKLKQHMHTYTICLLFTNILQTIFFQKQIPMGSSVSVWNTSSQLSQARVGW